MSKEAKIELEEDEYVERFKPFMMDIVYEWTKGASFREIIKMTDMFEVCWYPHCVYLMLVYLCIFCRYTPEYSGPTLEKYIIVLT